MITINTLKIEDSCNKISVDVTTEVGNVFTKIEVWNIVDYDDPLLVKDVSDLIIGTSENEVITITAQKLGVTCIEGVYLIYFTTDEAVLPGESTNKKFELVSNLDKYKECFLNKTANIELIDCNLMVDSCTTCMEEVYAIDITLTNLEFAIKRKYVTETQQLVNKLNTFCVDCQPCKKYI